MTPRPTFASARAPALSKIASGNVLAELAGPLPNTDYVRWFARLDGVDPEFRFLGRTDDLVKVIDDLPANGLLRVKAQAANGAAPSAFGPETTLQLGV